MYTANRFVLLERRAQFKMGEKLLVYDDSREGVFLFDFDSKSICGTPGLAPIKERYNLVAIDNNTLILVPRFYSFTTRTSLKHGIRFPFFVIDLSESKPLESKFISTLSSYFVDVGITSDSLGKFSSILCIPGIFYDFVHDTFYGLTSINVVSLSFIGLFGRDLVYIVDTDYQKSGFLILDVDALLKGYVKQNAFLCSDSFKPKILTSTASSDFNVLRTFGFSDSKSFYCMLLFKQWHTFSGRYLQRLIVFKLTKQNDRYSINEYNIEVLYIFPSEVLNVLHEISFNPHEFYPAYNFSTGQVHLVIHSATNYFNVKEEVFKPFFHYCDPHSSLFFLGKTTLIYDISLSSSSVGHYIVMDMRIPLREQAFSSVIYDLVSDSFSFGIPSSLVLSPGVFRMCYSLVPRGSRGNIMRCHFIPVERRSTSFDVGFSAYKANRYSDYNIIRYYGLK